MIGRRTPLGFRGCRTAMDRSVMDMLLSGWKMPAGTMPVMPGVRIIGLHARMMWPAGARNGGRVGRMSGMVVGMRVPRIGSLETGGSSQHDRRRESRHDGNLPRVHATTTSRNMPASMW